MGISDNWTLRTAVTRVRLPPDRLCTLTRAGAGGRRRTVALDAVEEFRYFAQSVVATAISVVVASTDTEGRLVPAMFNARAVNE